VIIPDINSVRDKEAKRSGMEALTESKTNNPEQTKEA
jgi:hypothetical protein